MRLNRLGGLNAIYIMSSIDGLAFSLIGIFIPIYLLELGYALTSIFFYFIVLNSALLIASYLAGIIAGKIGLKNTLFLRLPFLFAFLLFLLNLENDNTSLIILAVLGGLHSALYWVPANILFTRHAKEKNLGSSISKFFAFPQITSLLGPLTGGFIALLFGFKALFFMSFLILLFSVIPLIYASGLKDKFTFEFKKGVKFYKKHPKYFFSDVADNIGGESEGVIWPIFVYLNLLNVVSVGFVGMLISLGSILFTLAIGKFSDKYDKKRMIKIGSMLLMINWCFRYYLDSDVLLFVSTVFSGIFLALLLIPYTSLLYGSSKEEKNEEFLIFKETPTVIGRIIIFTIAILLAENIKLLFPLAGLSYLYYLFL